MCRRPSFNFDGLHCVTLHLADQCRLRVKSGKVQPEQMLSLGHQLLSFAFISPVDDATHTSSLGMSAFPDGRALRMGDVFQVLASRTKPDKTRQV